MEKYNFEIKCHEVPGFGEKINQWVKGYFYIISYFKALPSPHTITIESQEYLDTIQEAHFAAIGHISLLEQGERQDA